MHQCTSRVHQSHAPRTYIMHAPHTNITHMTTHVHHTHDYTCTTHVHHTHAPYTNITHMTKNIHHSHAPHIYIACMHHTRTSHACTTHPCHSSRPHHASFLTFPCHPPPGVGGKLQPAAADHYEGVDDDTTAMLEGSKLLRAQLGTLLAADGDPSPGAYEMLGVRPPPRSPPARISNAMAHSGRASGGQVGGCLLCEVP